MHTALTDTTLECSQVYGTVIIFKLHEISGVVQEKRSIVCLCIDQYKLARSNQLTNTGLPLSQDINECLFFFSYFWSVQFGKLRLWFSYTHPLINVQKKSCLNMEQPTAVSNITIHNEKQGLGVNTKLLIPGSTSGLHTYQCKSCSSSRLKEQSFWQILWFIAVVYRSKINNKMAWINIYWSFLILYEKKKHI